MPTSVLITGANSGIGREVARQFAERAAFDTVYLACRNPAKAEAARAELEQVTGAAIFTTVPIDTSDLRSVRAAIDLIEAPLQTVVCNAGGTGDSTRMALTRDGVTTTFASNVLGHVVLLEQLIAADALTGSAVLVGSEAARGVPRLGMKRPTFATHSVNEFASVMQYGFASGRSTHADRLETIRFAEKAYGITVDTHTADGIKVAREHLTPGVTMIVLETALPAKFNETIREALGRDAERPAGFDNIEALPQRFEVMPNDAARVKAYVAQHTGL